MSKKILKNKIYKRFPLKLWKNDCEECCMICEDPDECRDSCINGEITCNQCEYGGIESE